MHSSRLLGSNDPRNPLAAKVRTQSRVKLRRIYHQLKEFGLLGVLEKLPPRTTYSFVRYMGSPRGVALSFGHLETKNQLGSETYRQPIQVNDNGISTLWNMPQRELIDQNGQLRPPNSFHGDFGAFGWDPYFLSAPKIRSPRPETVALVQYYCLQWAAYENIAKDYELKYFATFRVDNLKSALLRPRKTTTTFRDLETFAQKKKRDTDKKPDDALGLGTLKLVSSELTHLPVRTRGSTQERGPAQAQQSLPLKQPESPNVMLTSVHMAPGVPKMLRSDLMQRNVANQAADSPHVGPEALSFLNDKLPAVRHCLILKDVTFENQVERYGDEPIRLYIGRCIDGTELKVQGGLAWVYLEKASMENPIISPDHSIRIRTTVRAKKVPLDRRTSTMIDYVYPFLYAEGDDQQIFALAKYYFMLAAHKNVFGFSRPTIPVKNTFVRELEKIWRKIPRHATKKERKAYGLFPKISKQATSTQLVLALQVDTSGNRTNHTILGQTSHDLIQAQGHSAVHGDSSTSLPPTHKPIREKMKAEAQQRSDKAKPNLDMKLTTLINSSVEHTAAQTEYEEATKESRQLEAD
ncbi:hypothetical protein P171DRAFT_441333 [Karstenula rhodostoma CBS 690.94]|uniref:Uncharacterized protein n=1 Tax=Karstenula rhodostoma CBS 690.94 TaxID=1392251 RepID=A0A9P4PRX5_9PLEO|nr:hypothetical protein P171DRAFT_441333 [Karstenula rhodostoma CBS 690.94]